MIVVIAAPSLYNYKAEAVTSYMHITSVFLVKISSNMSKTSPWAARNRDVMQEQLIGGEAWRVSMYVCIWYHLVCMCVWYNVVSMCQELGWVSGRAMLSTTSNWNIHFQNQT